VGPNKRDKVSQAPYGQSVYDNTRQGEVSEILNVKLVLCKKQHITNFFYSESSSGNFKKIFWEVQFFPSCGGLYFVWYLTTFKTTLCSSMEISVWGIKEGYLSMSI